MLRTLLQGLSTEQILGTVLCLNSEISSTGSLSRFSQKPHREKHSRPTHLPGQPQGDIALLSRVHNLHLKVMAAGAEWVSGLSQPHVHDALALPQILQQLWGRARRQVTLP